MKRALGTLAAGAALALCGAAAAKAPWTVQPAWVAADEAALAGDAMRGRGSATPDEARAAAFVAGQFRRFGLRPAPGMTGFTQTATVVRTHLTGAPELRVDGHAVAGVSLLRSSGAPISGRYAVVTGSAPPAGGVAAWLVSDPTGRDGELMAAAAQGGVPLLILPETPESRARFAERGTRLPVHLADEPAPAVLTVVTVPQDTIRALAKAGGGTVALGVPAATSQDLTTNAIGTLPGTDPKAGTILLSAHLDHLGVKPDGTIMHGANDDASGTTAVLELARALSAGTPPRRSILFVCYGSEEIGEFGSRAFAAHPPVPIHDLVANIEFEMIGAQDPHLPKGALMMTGFERSDLGPALKAHGALLASDPYPDQHFFERSDNYQLALTGVVAHTLSGWAEVPTYHQPTDTIANLDLPFMTRAIQSLVEPVRWLAGGDFVPAWTATGRPHE